MKEATLESILSALQKRDPDWVTSIKDVSFFFGPRKVAVDCKPQRAVAVAVAVGPLTAMKSYSRLIS